MLTLGINTINNFVRNLKTKKKGFKGFFLKPFLYFCLVLALNSCSYKSSDKPRLGYLLNITHALPIIAIEEGLFDEYHVEHYLSGGYLLNALMSGNIDIAYIGPGPYINAINKGVPLEVMSVSAVGANSFVVSDQALEKNNFKIKKIAVPQFGNTQDLLARSFVKRFNDKLKNKEKISKTLLDLVDALEDDKTVSFVQEPEFIAINPSELEILLHKNVIDAAFVAEPWGSILSQRGYKNLTQELTKTTLINTFAGEYQKNLSEEIQYMNSFPATLLVVKQDFYKQHVREIDNLLAKQDFVLDIINFDTQSAVTSIQNHFLKLTKQSLDEESIIQSLNNIEFYSDLNINKLVELEDIAYQVKYIRTKKIKGANT